jgi:hypothetical protein
VNGNAEAKRLLHELMKDYNKYVLPVSSINQTVNVTIGLKLSQLSDIDERNQIMTTNVWLEHVRHRLASIERRHEICLGMDGLQIDLAAQSLRRHSCRRDTVVGHLDTRYRSLQQCRWDL